MSGSSQTKSITVLIILSLASQLFLLNYSSLAERNTQNAREKGNNLKFFVESQNTFLIRPFLVLTGMIYMFDVIANENGTHFLIQKQYVFDFSLNLIQEKNFIYFSEEASL